MGLTGVIYALVVLAWAAYLLPQALRRHDEAARKHSIERFSSAMRVLARRGSAREDRIVMAPARTVDRVLTPSLSGSTPTATTAPAQRPRPSKAALRAAAARRRRVLLVLVSVTVVVALVAVFGVVPWWSVLVPVALIVAFLALARQQVRRASESYWDEVAEQPAEPTNVITRTGKAVRVDATHGAVRTSDEADTAQSSDDEPTVTLDREALTEARVEVGLVKTADGSSLWDPLPVTLPTYVDKPVAKRSFRTIDLGEPGTWSSGHSVADSRTAATAPATPASTASGKQAPAEGEEIGETPRAVNG